MVTPKTVTPTAESSDPKATDPRHGGAEPAGRSLTVLGCDGSWPGPGGAGSGYLVTAGGTSIMLDAGPGTFAQLQRHIDPGQLDAVILTHAHPDHWTDVEAMATWAGYGPGQDRFRGPGGRPLLVYAPPGLRERSSYGDTAWTDWRELPASDQLTLGQLEIRITATDHGIATRAIALSHGDATLAYSADSGPGWSVEAFHRPIGTFLCEATYTQEKEGSMLHLSGRQAGAMAAAAGVSRLIVTHRWPTVAADDLRREAELAFGQPVEQASMGAVFGW
jgi:ribonuclease BN (tRNA processing enzyme)